jgi:hypothetical protein
VAQPIDDPQTSTNGDALRLMELASATNTSLSDEFLLDSLRKSAKVSTRRIRADFVEVATGSRVLGYVSGHRKEFSALKGDDPAWAVEVGRYPSESLAIEALRMRRA